MAAARPLRWLILLLGMMAATVARPAHAEPAAVAPVVACANLARADLAGVAGAAVTAQATVLDTPKGRFCKVTGTIAPAIGFEVDLPLAGWTGRYLQNGCGGLCGTISVSPDKAGTCAPAIDGHMVVAASDLGHQNSPGPGGNMAAFATDPQKRIDFAYRANHLTALVAKALIRVFYGQGPRFSYFSGCSDGGREAMMEAERFPDDFDGISAGAPVMNFQVQNSFYHAWLATANLRPDGSPILLAAKLPLLHAAVMTHCDRLDGIADGLLSDPRACPVDPAWAACATGATDTSRCLAADEVAAARRLYEGPKDKAGRPYLVGLPQPGSELQWDFIPQRAGEGSFSATIGSMMVRSMILPEGSIADGDLRRFAFDDATFAKVTQLHSLNDSTDPDLRPFARHGGRLIMYHGWSDVSVSPLISLAYYKAVQALIGADATDRFYRLFMLPGTGHCGGGDGFSQIDTLTPLIAWVESGRAPAVLPAGKVAELPRAPAGGPRPVSLPLPRPDQPASAVRPIFPFPAIPRPQGSGYVGGPSPAGPEASAVAWRGSGLIVPGFQRAYEVRDGRLVALPR